MLCIIFIISFCIVSDIYLAFKGIIKDFAKQRYNTPYACNVISPTADSSSIEITEIDLGSALFAYKNVFISLLNYMQYKLAFTH